MKITEMRYMFEIVSEDLDAGMALYEKLRSNKDEPGVENPFKALSPSGYLARELGIKEVADIVDDFRGTEFTPALASLGYSEDEIEALRGIVKVRYYDRFETGEYVASDATLNQLLTDLGKTIN